MNLMYMYSLLQVHEGDGDPRRSSFVASMGQLGKQRQKFLSFSAFTVRYNVVPGFLVIIFEVFQAPVKEYEFSYPIPKQGPFVFD